MWSDGEVHHEMRKFTSRTLRTFGFGELKATQELLQTEIGNLFKQIDEERSRSSLVDEVSMHHKFKIPTFNILWKVMAGERFGYDDPRIEALILAVDDVARINIGLGKTKQVKTEGRGQTTGSLEILSHWSVTWFQIQNGPFHFFDSFPDAHPVEQSDRVLSSVTISSL